MKVFFVAAHFVIPFVGLSLLQLALTYHVELSWQILVVYGVSVLPFALPLITAYVGKLGPVTMKTLGPWWAVIPGAPDKTLLSPATENVLPVPQQQPAVAPDHAQAAGPNFDALTADEKRVLKTLWTYQLQHTAGNGDGWWGFQVPESSADYPSYLRGAGSLSERKLVSLAGGMVFLNEFGLRYCKQNIEKLRPVENYWKHFSPLSGV